MLKSLCTTLEKQTAVIEEMICNREDTFSDRSDRWQEGEKGMEFEERTEQLQEILDVTMDLLSLVEEVQ